MSPIENLSWEILDLILSHLPGKEIHRINPATLLPFVAGTSLLPSYATVCKSWSQHIERRTFKSIRVKSTELEQLFSIVTGHRIAALLRLSYEVVLPTYSDHACAKFETEKDQERNNVAFTEAICGLFRGLKSWENDAEDNLPVNGQSSSSAAVDDRCFEIYLKDIYSLMDGIWRGKERYKEDRLQWELGKRHDLWGLRYQNSFLRFLDSESLPVLNRVSRFSNSYTTRNAAPDSLALITSKFNHLQDLQLICSDDEKKHPEVRQRLRYDFAQRLQELPSNTIQTLSLEYQHQAPLNHNFTPISALHANSYIDHLSQALHKLSQAPNLTSLILDGPIVISSDLFWPSSASATPPAWPKLQDLHLTFNPCTPSGSWYFKRHPSKTADDDQWDEEDEVMREQDSESETDSDSDASDDSAIWDSHHPNREGRLQGDFPVRMFRNYPVDEEILPLITAIAKAVRFMPALQILTVESTPDGHPDDAFKVAFIAAGKKNWEDEGLEDAKEPRLYWRMGDWRPSEEVLGLWRESVPGLLVRFLEG